MIRCFMFKQLYSMQENVYLMLYNVLKWSLPGLIKSNRRWTNDQNATLMRFRQANPYPNHAQIYHIAKAMNVSLSRVKSCFKNQYYKKKAKEQLSKCELFLVKSQPALHNIKNLFLKFIIVIPVFIIMSKYVCEHYSVIFELLGMGCCSSKFFSSAWRT